MGVSMQALTACAVAALTIYDMCKAVDRSMVIGALHSGRRAVASRLTGTAHQVGDDLQDVLAPENTFARRVGQLDFCTVHHCC